MVIGNSIACNNTTKEILNRHFIWHKKGVDFQKINQVKANLSKANPFNIYGSSAINFALGIFEEDEADITIEALGKLTYIIIHEEDFDGNIDFLQYCINLKQLYINGMCYPGKINDLGPLSVLYKLEYLYLTHHNFTDISPLSKYTELSEITLTDNPIKTIDPIVKLSKIQSIRLLETEEKEIFELLSNNKSAVASFCSTQYDLCFTAYWIQDWGFKTSYIKHYTYINVTVEPLMLDNFMELNNPVSLNKYLTLMKSKAKQIALSLLNEDEQFKGKVNYKTQSLHLVNSYFNFENK